MLTLRHALVAILPCTEMGRSLVFYARLGFVQRAGDDSYAMLEDALGAQLHLRSVARATFAPEGNPLGLYLYSEAVDELATVFSREILGKVPHPEHKPWGMYEFAIADPDGTLVRIGRPSKTRPLAELPPLL